MLCYSTLHTHTHTHWSRELKQLLWTGIRERGREGQCWSSSSIVGNISSQVNLSFHQWPHMCWTSFKWVKDLLSTLTNHRLFLWSDVIQGSLLKPSVVTLISIQIHVAVSCYLALVCNHIWTVSKWSVWLVWCWAGEWTLNQTLKLHHWTKTMSLKKLQLDNSLWVLYYEVRYRRRWSVWSLSGEAELWTAIAR